MFYAISKHPHIWNTKLNLFVALSPVTRIDHTTADLFKFGAKFSDKIKSTLNFFHVYELFGQQQDGITKLTCKVLPDFCKAAESFFVTQDPILDDSNRFQVFMGHYPAGASVQSFLHYAQEINEKDFMLFDYGSAEANQAKYGQDTPPAVNLTNINNCSPPISMFAGFEDSLGDTTDAEWTRD